MRNRINDMNDMNDKHKSTKLMPFIIFVEIPINRAFVSMF